MAWHYRVRRCHVCYSPGYFNDGDGNTCCAYHLSKYQEYKTRGIIQVLADKVGMKAYRAWFERTFEVDGKNANDFSWKQMGDLAQTELERIEREGWTTP